MTDWADNVALGYLDTLQAWQPDALLIEHEPSRLAALLRRVDADAREDCAKYAETHATVRDIAAAIRASKRGT